MERQWKEDREWWGGKGEKIETHRWLNWKSVPHECIWYNDIQCLCIYIYIYIYIMCIHTNSNILHITYRYISKNLNIMKKVNIFCHLFQKVKPIYIFSSLLLVYIFLPNFFLPVNFAFNMLWYSTPWTATPFSNDPLWLTLFVEGVNDRLLDHCQVSSVPHYCGFKEQEITTIYTEWMVIYRT